MQVEVTAGEPDATGADLVAVGVGARASDLGAPERAIADADPVATVYRQSRAPLLVVAVEPDRDGLRTAAARAVRASRGAGTVAWALDPSLPVALEQQVQALAEGAVIGGYDGRRWRGHERRPTAVGRFVICGGAESLASVADRAALVARWTNGARELVDAPPNIVSPAGLAERAAALPRLTAAMIDPVEAGLGALAAVGGSSPIPPRLIVLRHQPPGAPAEPRLVA
jgi:leucyl aminopeptidase